MRKTREILRLALGQGMSMRQIAQSLSISSSTVHDCLGRVKVAGLSWPLDPAMDDARLESTLYPPPGLTPKERTFPDCSYIHGELHRKGVTLMLLWQEYKTANPDGLQYSQFCDRYGQFRRQLDVVMHQTHRAGEKLFVDFSGDGIPITNPVTGEVREAPLFVAALGASSYTFVEVMESEDLPSWIQAHVYCFEYMQGVAQITVPDNTKTAVTRPCFYEPDINRTYLEMAQHYNTVVIPARKGRARDKAKVESGVLVAQRWVLAALRNQTFFSIAQARRAVAQKREELNDRPLKKLGVSRRELFGKLDRPALQPLPAHRFEYADWLTPTVNVDYHVECFKHFYSVPYQLVGKKLEARVTLTTVEMLHKGVRVATHARSNVKAGYTTLREHMPERHQHYLDWTPERIIHWAAETGPSTAALAEAIIASRAHPQQGFRACLGILRLGRVYGKERLEAACARALALQALSYRSVESILKSGLERAPRERPRPTAPVLHGNVRGPEYYE